MFGICSIDVPSPCAKKPLKPLSRKLMTAKPIICAQQPAVAAPPAIPVMPSMIAIAAELMGSVKIIPMTTESTMPIQNGSSSVALCIPLPRAADADARAGPKSNAAAAPAMTVTAGTTTISILVFPATSLPHSAPTKAAAKAESGSPGPAKSTLPFSAIKVACPALK